MDYHHLSEIYQKKQPAVPKTLDQNDPRVSFLHRHLPTAKTSRLLDAGCGTGEVARYLAVIGYRHIIGLDLFEHLETGGAFEYLQGNVTDTKLPGGSQDFIYCLGVLNHVPDPRDAFREFRRLLRPGGVVVFSAHTKYSLFTLERRLYRRLGYRRHLRGANFRSFREYDRMLHQSGFQTVEIDGYKLIWMPMVVDRMYKKLRKTIQTDPAGPNGGPRFDHSSAIKRLRATWAYQMIIAARVPAV